MRRINPTLLAMWMSMLAYGFVMQIVILFAAKRRLYYTIGAWTGVLVAIVCSGLLLYAINRTVDRDEKSAKGYAVGSYFMRLILMAAVLVVLAITQAGSVVAAFIGIFSMKISAYLQGYIQKLPFMRRFFTTEESLQTGGGTAASESFLDDAEITDGSECDGKERKEVSRSG